METIRGDLSTVTNGTMEVSYLCKGISRKLLNLLIYALFFIFGSFNKIVLISCDWQDQRSRRFFCTPFKLMFSPRFVRIKPIFFHLQAVLEKVHIEIKHFNGDVDFEV